MSARRRREGESRDRCHGTEQEGSVGPSLIASLAQRSKQEVIGLILDGAQDRGMPACKTVPAHVEPVAAFA